jgi:mitotic spindle assembly checkpoint protein MAD2
MFCSTLSPEASLPPVSPQLLPLRRSYHMSAVAQATSTEITLRGSTEIVTEFFGYSINSILYQRGIYPPESFTRVQKYGLPMQVTSDEGLSQYLNQVLSQLASWLLGGEVQKVVIVICGVNSGETLERWAFNVETDKALTTGAASTAKKSQKAISNEIQAIIRQITASVTFLPLLQEPCTFDMLVYTDAQASVPQAWEESDPKYISNSTDVKLRSFTTKVHKVDSMVSYKNDEEEI